jgi:hypothetical protein
MEMPTCGELVDEGEGLVVVGHFGDWTGPGGLRRENTSKDKKRREEAERRLSWVVEKKEEKKERERERESQSRDGDLRAKTGPGREFVSVVVVVVLSGLAITG